MRVRSEKYEIRVNGDAIDTGKDEDEMIETARDLNWNTPASVDVDVVQIQVTEEVIA